MVPLNFRLRFITEAGQFDRKAIAAAITAKAGKSSRDYAHRYIWSEARGEMALYEMRVLTRAEGLKTVSDQVHGNRAPETSNVRAA